MILRVILFLILNFTALGIGGLATSDAVSADWYLGLTKAPWTPPGWVFGAAWTTIMICFSIYLAFLWPSIKNKKYFIALYGFQWVLNVGWNPTFFYFHQVLMGLIVIVGLTFLIGYYLFQFRAYLKFKSMFILPYFIWLLIATSLNGYILVFN